MNAEAYLETHSMSKADSQTADVANQGRAEGDVAVKPDIQEARRARPGKFTAPSLKIHRRRYDDAMWAYNCIGVGVCTVYVCEWDPPRFRHSVMGTKKLQ